MVIRPQPRREREQDRSLYVKQNKKYQALLAALIIMFLLVFAAVVNRVGLPSSSAWQDNVLIRLITETQEAIRNRP